MTGSLWRHRKGGLYRYITLAIREEDEQPVVVYRDCLTAQVYTRLAAQFHDGRFRRVNPGEADGGA
jgi:hypothetical protein